MTNEKYDQDFANAMALKLRLNREARAKTIEPKPPEDDFPPRDGALDCREARGDTGRCDELPREVRLLTLLVLRFIRFSRSKF